MRRAFCPLGPENPNKGVTTINLRRKLVLQKNPYDLHKTRSLFLEAVRENVAFHMAHSPEYAQILKAADFSLEALDSEEALHKIPSLPTLYYKRNRLFSLPEERMVIRAVSSGTKGAQSQVAFDKKSLLYGILMMIRYFSHHRLISLLPTNYIILGYEPSIHTQMGAIKTAYGTTKFAPALHREYALKDTGTGYEPNLEGVKKALLRYEKIGLPVRFVGFPSYLLFLIQLLRESGIAVKLNRKSKIFLGGGWKQFADEEIDRDLLLGLVRETLGIEKDNVLEFFSAVEHPLPYVKCKNGHFHVPVYSRVIIRDVSSLEPVPMGSLGLLSFVSPLVGSMPLTSVVTDDLAVLHEGRACGCGIESPYFELKGRAGVGQIKTCTADALEMLRGGAQ